MRTWTVWKCFRHLWNYYYTIQVYMYNSIIKVALAKLISLAFSLCLTMFWHLNSSKIQQQFRQLGKKKLKGHGNEAEIFVIEKRLPDSMSLWLGKSGNRWLAPTHRCGEFSSKHSIADRRIGDSPTRRIGESVTPWLVESEIDYEYFREFETKIGTARNVV